MKVLSEEAEGKIIQLGVVAFWALFWLLNTIDKFANGTEFWVGKDRLSQFIGYLSSININNQNIAFSLLAFITVLEFIAFILTTGAFIKLLEKKKEKAHTLFFWGTLVGITIFSLFSMGDQVFGDRAELLEHSIYWTALIISWGAYKYFPKTSK